MILYSGARIEPKSKFDGKYLGTPTLTDVALGLGRVPRFGGQSRRWWSGLHHAFVCMRIAADMGMSARMAVLCLLHDAHEAVTGDVPAFFKPASLAQDQADIDERFFSANGLWPITEAEHIAIKEVDDRALKAEALVVGPPNIMAHLGAPRVEDMQIVEFFQEKYPSPTDTDGLHSAAATYFILLYSSLIGDAVLVRHDDHSRN